MTDDARALWQRRAIIVLLALILVAVVSDDDGGLTTERIGALGVAAAAVLYALVDATKRAGLGGGPNTKE